MNMYGVKDIKAGIFLQPFFVTHDVIAIRMFKGSVRQKDSLLHDFPDDYALYRLGHWDEREGKVTQDAPEFELLCYAYEVLDDREDEEELG